MNINDFVVDLSTYASLQTASESVVKQNLNYPNTADFNWFTTGKCERYYDYYMIGCNFTAENAFGVEDEHYFRIDSIVTEDSSDLVYYELDGQVMFGEPSVPELVRKPIDVGGLDPDGNIKITDGIIGECGKEDVFDGEKHIRYYVPSGKYIAKCETKNSSFFIETIELHKEDGYDVATTIERISFSSTEESFEIEINDGECISLVFNSIIILEPIK